MRGDTNGFFKPRQVKEILTQSVYIDVISRMGLSQDGSIQGEDSITSIPQHTAWPPGCPVLIQGDMVTHTNSDSKRGKDLIAPSKHQYQPEGHHSRLQGYTHEAARRLWDFANWSCTACPTRRCLSEGIAASKDFQRRRSKHVWEYRRCGHQLGQSGGCCDADGCADVSVIE